MRILTSHIAPNEDTGPDQIKVAACDEPGPGGACHSYRMWAETTVTLTGPQTWRIDFQKGPVIERGLNGVTNEALLAIVEDRLLSFQRGEFACVENSIALTHLQETLRWLHKRTLDRINRGVEGTMER